MAIINPINKGAYSAYNNMTMWRKYDSEIGFKTRFKVNEQNDTLDGYNNIVVPYIQYFTNESGSLVEKLSVGKTYQVVNYPATYYIDGDTIPSGSQIGDVKTTACMMANDWFLGLARTPVNVAAGVMDSIEYTLNLLPQDIPDGFKLPRNT